MKINLLQWIGKMACLVAAAVLSAIVFVAGVFAADSGALLLGPVTIHFARGGVELDQASLDEIARLAGELAPLSPGSILVEGFSDASRVGGGNPYADNQALSLARAKLVAGMLQSRSGHPEKLFAVRGAGVDRPIAGNDTEEGRARNRRVEVRVFGAGVQQTGSQSKPDAITLTLRDVGIDEVFEMLSRLGRVNIVLEKGVAGRISLNLFDVSLDDAIRLAADSAGYAVEKRSIGYVIGMPRPPAAGPMVEEKANTGIKTFKVQYADPAEVEKVMTKHLSKHGRITLLAARNLLVVEDLPEVLVRVETLLLELDRHPKQILIEAKILEITLDESDSFGLDWEKFFSHEDGAGSLGVKKLTTGASGFIFQFKSNDVTALLDLLQKKGRVHTLSSPKLLTVENKEASVIIGDRQGYTVTTTINEVIQQSVEFLESGIILKVTPSVDRDNRIMLNIYPEVSSGSISEAGVPSKTTTAVSTVLLADNGQPIFIGGLIKKQSDVSRSGVPVLADIPLFGRAFSNEKETVQNRETVVLITPFIIEKGATEEHMRQAAELVREKEKAMPSLPSASFFSGAGSSADGEPGR